jgi:hypothetical protein
MYAFFICPMLATCSTHLILLHLIIIITELKLAVPKGSTKEGLLLTQQPENGRRTRLRNVVVLTI